MLQKVLIVIIEYKRNIQIQKMKLQWFTHFVGVKD